MHCSLAQQHALLRTMGAYETFKSPEFARRNVQLLIDVLGLSKMDQTINIYWYTSVAHTNKENKSSLDAVPVRHVLTGCYRFKILQKTSPPWTTLGKKTKKTTWLFSQKTTRERKPGWDKNCGTSHPKVLVLPADRAHACGLSLETCAVFRSLQRDARVRFGHGKSNAVQYYTALVLPKVLEPSMVCCSQDTH